MKLGNTDRTQPRRFVIFLGHWAEQWLLNKLEQASPQFPFLQRFQKPCAAIAGGSAGLVEGIKRRMARHRDETCRKAYRVSGPAQIIERAHQPLLIVSIIVDLIGQNKLADHVSMVDTRTCLLLPCGVV